MRTPLLDHGYLEVVEHWGSDERIIEAARMSTDKGFQGWGPNPCSCLDPDPEAMPRSQAGCPKCGGLGQVPGDEKLLRYMWEHRHSSPFEFAGLVVEVQAPIMVFREWHRHRTQSFSELSARYTPMPNLSYVPTTERLLINASSTNKQAGTVAGSNVLTPGAAEEFRHQLGKLYEHAEELYQKALCAGVPKELARLPVPVARYSRMRASANLRNWLAFLTLRNDAAAQWEVRQFAMGLQTLLAERFPRTLALFAEGQAK